MESSPTTSKFLLAIVPVDCKWIFSGAEKRLIANPVLQEGTSGAMLCQGDELHYLWQSPLFPPEHQLTAFWVQPARQLPRFNFEVPSLTLWNKSPGSKHSGSVSTKSSVTLERPLSSEQLLLWKESST